MQWTEPMVECVRALLLERLSAAQIAVEISREFNVKISPNAIIGKVHRMSLGQFGGSFDETKFKRARPVRRPQERMMRLTKQPIMRLTNHGSRFDMVEVNAPAPVILTPEDDLNIPAAQRCTVVELTTDNCHWPVGDPRSPEFFFCGGRAVEGEPYCAAHCQRAYGAKAGDSEPRHDVVAVRGRAA